ncbi:PREDICTED: centromere protein X [Crocodylus porosus]|uniref:centromere protein X n=1 Tax=Crocodylus porosus TaxID=8502 RepID=UPI00093A801B|nr:PREDICTED: centromere protein X [Crocodylus porosus]
MLGAVVGRRREEEGEGRASQARDGGAGRARGRVQEVGGEALALLAEMLKVFVREAAVRAARQARAEDLARVDVEHVEKVLPQLLLDF